MKKRAQDLKDMATSRPEKFRKVWQALLGQWAEEIQKRGRNLRFREHDVSSPEAVFGVLEQASQLLTLCGDNAERMVGARTREFLTDECSRAVALALSPQMHRLCLNWDKFYKPGRRTRATA